MPTSTASWLVGPERRFDPCTCSRGKWFQRNAQEAKLDSDSELDSESSSHSTFDTKGSKMKISEFDSWSCCGRPMAESRNLLERAGGGGARAVLIALVSVALLTACGGGGSTATPLTPPTPVDARITIDGFTPAVGATAVAVDSTVTVRYTVTGTVDGVTRAAPACGGVPVPGTWANPSAGLMVFTAAAPAPNGVLCKGTVTIAALGTDGGRPASLTAEYSYTTMPAPADWYRAVPIVPAGTKITDIKQTFEGCISQSQACWREMLLTGHLKVSGPGQVIFGRPTYSISLQNRNSAFGGTGLYTTLTVNADDFSPVDTFSLQGGSNGRIEWVIVTSEGVIRKFSAATDCGLWAYRREAGGFNQQSVACPP